MAWLLLLLSGVVAFGLYFPLRLVLLHATINITLVIVLFYGSGWVIRHYFLAGKVGVAVLLELVLFVAVSAPRIGINMYLSQVFTATMHNNTLISPLLRITALVVATSACVLVFGISFALQQHHYRRERQNRALILEQQTAQLNFLKAQINPHFLFNALNNLYSLVELKSPDAPKMLLKLSELLRYVIYNGRQKTVAIATEVVHIQNFIALFQMRNEYPANIVFEIQGNMQALEIEPMILIPLVENCFKHTDFDLNTGAFAQISLTVTPQQLLFTTSNTFQENDHQKDSVGGVGLSNIVNRLALRYPNQHQFVFGKNENIFNTQLSIQFNAQ